VIQVIDRNGLIAAVFVMKNDEDIVFEGAIFEDFVIVAALIVPVEYIIASVLCSIAIYFIFENLSK